MKTWILLFIPGLSLCTHYEYMIIEPYDPLRESYADPLLDKRAFNWNRYNIELIVDPCKDNLPGCCNSTFAIPQYIRKPEPRLLGYEIALTEDNKLFRCREPCIGFWQEVAYSSPVYAYNFKYVVADQNFIWAIDIDSRQTFVRDINLLQDWKLIVGDVVQISVSSPEFVFAIQRKTRSIISCRKPCSGDWMPLLESLSTRKGTERVVFPNQLLKQVEADAFHIYLVSLSGDLKVRRLNSRAETLFWEDNFDSSLEFMDITPTLLLASGEFVKFQVRSISLTTRGKSLTILSENNLLMQCLKPCRSGNFYHIHTNFETSEIFMSEFHLTILSKTNTIHRTKNIGLERLLVFSKKNMITAIKPYASNTIDNSFIVAHFALVSEETKLEAMAEIDSLRLLTSVTSSLIIEFPLSNLKDESIMSIPENIVFIQGTTNTKRINAVNKTYSVASNALHCSLIHHLDILSHNLQTDYEIDRHLETSCKEIKPDCRWNHVLSSCERVIPEESSPLEDTKIDFHDESCHALDILDYSSGEVVLEPGYSVEIVEHRNGFYLVTKADFLCLDYRIREVLPNSRPACWDNNESVVASEYCYDFTNIGIGMERYNFFPACLNVGYLSTNVIWQCDNGANCGTYLELHIKNDERVINRRRLPPEIPFTSGFHTTYINTTFMFASYEEFGIKTEKVALICQGFYQIWWVQYQSDGRKIVEYRKDFSVSKPECIWDVDTSSELLYAVQDTPDIHNLRS